MQNKPYFMCNFKERPREQNKDQGNVRVLSQSEGCSQLYFKLSPKIFYFWEFMTNISATDKKKFKNTVKIMRLKWFQKAQNERPEAFKESMMLYNLPNNHEKTQEFVAVSSSPNLACWRPEPLPALWWSDGHHWRSCTLAPEQLAERWAPSCHTMRQEMTKEFKIVQVVIFWSTRN